MFDFTFVLHYGNDRLVKPKKKCMSPERFGRSGLLRELSVTRFGQCATAKDAETGNTWCHLKHCNVDRHTHDA